MDDGRVCEGELTGEMAKKKVRGPSRGCWPRANIDP